VNPHLTLTGRLVLFSGLVFTIVGAAATSVPIVLLGQVQILALAVGFVLISPAALVLDRRLVKLRVEPEEAARMGTGHVVGDEVDVELEVRNDSDQVLHNFRAEPYAAEALEVEDTDVATIVGGATAAARFEAQADRCGRWMLHGFDVTVTDPIGLVETRDYLPCNHAFEFYPAAGRLRRRARRRPPQTSVGSGHHLVERVGHGTEIRQLRDFRPGDSLRDVAWKATLRSRKLISREFEREVSANVYVALDISSSMRGGRWAGQKLEWATHLTVDFAEELLGSRDRVGLLTFDEKMYGHIVPGNSNRHMQRILHHLVGLNSVVDEELTELDETELRRLAADYLLVQERLDFRRGSREKGEVNRALLDRWLRSIMAESRARYGSGVVQEGIVVEEPSPLRRFLQYRGVSIPYRVEARLGMKERGLIETLEHVVKTSSGPHWIFVITDLCAIMNAETLVRGVNLARADGHHVEFVVPFTPAFYAAEPDDPKYEVVRELFTQAEAEERARIVSRLRSVGVRVDVVRPEATGLHR
jgi:uncharacterized protein (DUF58 family)